MLHKLAIYIAKALYESLDDEKKSEHRENGLDYKNLESRIKVLLINLCLFIVLLLVSYFFHIGKELFWGTLVFAIARIWNGGHHFESTDVCFLITAGVLLVIPALNYYFSDFAYYFAFASIVLNTLFAPFHFAKSHKKSLIKKAISLLACIGSIWLGSIVIIAIFAQSIDLIHKHRVIK